MNFMFEVGRFYTSQKSDSIQAQRRCYLCCVPIKQSNPESWVLSLVKHMERDLRSVGIDAYRTTKNSNVEHTMTLLIASEALLHTYHTSTSRSFAARKFRILCTQQKIIVVLISGTMSTSIPVPFLNCFRIDMRSLGYVRCMHRLVSICVSS